MSFMLRVASASRAKGGQSRAAGGVSSGARRARTKSVDALGCGRSLLRFVRCRGPAGTGGGALVVVGALVGAQDLAHAGLRRVSRRERAARGPAGGSTVGVSTASAASIRASQGMRKQVLARLIDPVLLLC